MTDITTALETVKDWIPLTYEGSEEAVAALVTIEAELTRLREERDTARRGATVYVDASEYEDELRKAVAPLVAERDEAVAALREVRRKSHEAASMAVDNGSNITAHWFMDFRDIADAALARLSTPKEPTA